VTGLLQWEPEYSTQTRVWWGSMSCPSTVATVAGLLLNKVLLVLLPCKSLWFPAIHFF